MNETEKIFATKTGFCHVLPDRIILSREGIIGNISETTAGNTISRILILYIIVSCLFIFGAYTFYVEGQFPQMMIFGLVALYFLFGIIRSLNNSAAPVIERDKIRSVKFRSAIPGLTRAHFEIRFQDTKGKIKKRLILLPGSMSGGQNETETAIRIMKEEGLLSS
jgi:hypothetical protein